MHNAGSCLVVLLAALLYDRKYEAGEERRANAPAPAAVAAPPLV